MFSHVVVFFITLPCLQHLVEKVWYAVTETCLAFTVFRDDFSPKFIALFTLLLFLKSFHWLAEDRVDYVSLVLLTVKIQESLYQAYIHFYYMLLYCYYLHFCNYICVLYSI